MAKKTAAELVAWAESILGTPYVYGMKYQVLTQSLLNSLAASYPSTFTSSYIKKAQAFIGQICVDCSGVISACTGTERNSSGYKSTAIETVAISKLDDTMIGWGLWKSGHIGVYIGNGYLIEARGIDYGTVRSKVSSRDFTYAIKLCDIDYDTAEQPVYYEGWIQADDGRWWYQYADGTYPANGWYWLSEVTGGTSGWYLFDADGWMLTGYQVDAAGEGFYLCESGTHEGQCMITDDRGVLIPGNDYDFTNRRYV